MRALVTHRPARVVANTVARCAAILGIGLCAVSAASAADLAVITGAAGGTYYQFGLDLKRLLKAGGIDLAVHPSRGAVENIVAINQRPGIQLGIVQSDVLGFVSGVQADPTLSQIARNTRMVFPLYDEEVHVVGRRGITDFDQLAGKRVAVGLEGSGTYLTARLLFKLSEVRPAEMVPLDATQALAQLKAGRIDAMVYVAGAPVRLLKDHVTAKDGLALIPISNRNILDAYATTEIAADVYDWQTTAVTTAAVKAVLVTVEGRNEHCEAVGRLAEQVVKGRESLASSGHPKWKAVDLDASVKGWEPYDCVRKHLARPTSPPAAPATEPAPAASPAAERNPVADAIKGVFGKD